VKKVDEQKMRKEMYWEERVVLESENVVDKYFGKT
jgi:hypothetical protein